VIASAVRLLRGRADHLKKTLQHDVVLACSPQYCVFRALTTPTRVGSMSMAMSTSRHSRSVAHTVRPSSQYLKMTSGLSVPAPRTSCTGVYWAFRVGRVLTAYGPEPASCVAQPGLPVFLPAWSGTSGVDDVDSGSRTRNGAYGRLSVGSAWSGLVTRGARGSGGSATDVDADLLDAVQGVLDFRGRDLRPVVEGALPRSIIVCLAVGAGLPGGGGGRPRVLPDSCKPSPSCRRGQVDLVHVSFPPDRSNDAGGSFLGYDQGLAARTGAGAGSGVRLPEPSRSASPTTSGRRGAGAKAGLRNRRRGIAGGRRGPGAGPRLPGVVNSGSECECGLPFLAGRGAPR